MGGEQLVQRPAADLRGDVLGVGSERVRKRLRCHAVRVAVVVLPRDDESGPLQGSGHLVERVEPDRVGVGHRRPLGRRERWSLLEREGEAPAGPERRGDVAYQRVLVLESEHRLEQEHDVEGAAWEGRDVRGRKAAREVARALDGDGDGARARVHAQVHAAKLPGEETPGPAQAAAQVQHRDPRADADLYPQGPDLAGGHEALLPDELAGSVRRHARAVQRPVERRAVVLPHGRALVGTRLTARGDEPNAVRKRSRNAAMRQTGASGPGSMPSCQLHPAIWCNSLGSWAMTEMGTSWLAPWPVTTVAG